MAMSTGHLLPPQLAPRRDPSPPRGPPPLRGGSPCGSFVPPPPPPALAPEAEADGRRAGPEAMLEPPLAAELRPPQRELGIAQTAELLRRFRREENLLTELSLAELEDFAELCSPLSFKRGELLFARGEPCSWLGLLLAGRASALLPGGASGGGSGELRLGEHAPGEMLGLARVALWERSHARPYTLRGLDDGCIAVLSYDQLESLRRARPGFHHALLRALLLQLADGCGAFFRGCPVSNNLKWSLGSFTERRILDFLLQLRDQGKLLTNLDYHALLALACRLRVTQWQARSNVLSKGEPLSGCLILLDGKFTGFRDAGGSPSLFFGPGDCVGLEFLLGGVQPCPLDIFAARPSLAALLLPSDLEDLRREYPGLATQLLQALYSKLFLELAAPQPEALLLLAEATERLRFAPGHRPAYPTPLRYPGLLTPEEATVALKMAEATAPKPRWVNPSHSSKVLEGTAAREDAAIRRFLTDPYGLTASWAEQEPAKAEWLLGSFLTQKLVDSQIAGPEHRAKAREAALQAIGLETRRPALSDGRQHPLSPAGGFDGFGANVEARIGLRSPERARDRSRERESPRSRSHWKEAGLKAAAAERGRSRPSSAPPSKSGASFGAAPARGAAPQWPSSAPGAEQGIMDLMSAPPPSFNCPHCNKKVHLPKSLTPSSLEAGVVKTGPRSRRGEEEGLQPQRRKVAKVVSSTYRHGNRADFYLDGKKVALESGKWQLHEYQRRGFNVVTLDPDSQQIISAMSYDVSGSGNVAAAQLAADLNALPEGRVVLIAVRGSGMEALSGAAVRALGRVGASSAVSGGRSQEGYALIGIKGGEAAERRGHHVEVEAKLPRPPWQEPQDLSWYFQQQKRFLEDLKVSEDRHDAWNSKVFMQEEEIEKLKQQVRNLEEERDGLRKDMKEAVRERDEWQVSALRVMSKREFRSSVEALEAARRRPLPP